MMKIRDLGLSIVLCLPACGSGTDAESNQQELRSAANEGHHKALAACHLDDGTVEADSDVHACDPQDKKKTTICHVPPGNPTNAHTLCVGNPAVPAHLRNHAGDHVGACKVEAPCVPPGGMGGAGGGGSGGMSGTGGTGGSAPPAGSGGSGGAGAGGMGGQPAACGAGIAACDATGECVSGVTCVNGCCPALIE